MPKWVFWEGRDQKREGQPGAKMWCLTGWDFRRQCCRAELRPPVPHHIGKGAKDLSTGLIASYVCLPLPAPPGATFLVRQVLMTEVKRIKEVGWESSEPSGDVQRTLW